MEDQTQDKMIEFQTINPDLEKIRMKETQKDLKNSTETDKTDNHTERRAKEKVKKWKGSQNRRKNKSLNKKKDVH